jgi:aldo/keto reductase family protein
MPQLLPLRLLETVGLRSSEASRQAAAAAAAARTSERPSDPAHELARAGSAEPPTGVVDIDPAIESTGPLSIIAPRRIGESDLTVYPLSLGASVFGWTADGDTSLAILDRFAELGGNFIDTADSYVGGRSEVLIGNWMRDRGNRDRVVVGTKVGRHHENPGLGAVSIVRAVEASLERLKTDYIDVLYFHDDDP